MIQRQVYRKSIALRRWLGASSAHTAPSSTAAQRVHTVVNPRTLLCSKSYVRRGFLNHQFGIKGRYFTTQALSDLPVCGVIDVPLAQTGEGIAECELLKWFVNEGDLVEEFQPLCEVQSDKATIEITSRYKGKVFKILHSPGDIVKVGEILLKLVVDENENAFSDQHNEASEDITTLDQKPHELNASDSTPRKEKIGGVLCTPAVRNLAKQLGLNIDDIHGTGKGGRVSKEDVLNYAAREGFCKEASVNQFLEEEKEEEDQKFPDVSNAYSQGYEDRTITLRGYQRAMVKSMNLAAKIPHFHYVEEINCDALVELKSSFQKENSDPSVKHTFLPMLIKSLSAALNKYPLLNSCFDEKLQEVTVKGPHNIGIAMATPHGLVVPNIKKVQSLSIFQITMELSRLQYLASANKLSSDDISGGTITLSNIGAIGGKFGSPLINVPEVSIIAMGRIQKTPRFIEDGSICAASIMTVNVGADHRVLDGATVAKFCNEWKQYIEKPELLMLHMR